mgnify:CR=1 FL=1
MPESITTMQIIETWLAVGFTLMIYTFLYKDNPIFKLGEYIYVELTAGYAVCYAWFTVIWPDLIYPLYRALTVSFHIKQWEKPLESHENLWLIIPLVLGILMLTRFSSKFNWLSRYTLAFIMGSVSGMSIPLVVSANIFKQMVPTLNPFWGPEVTIFQTINTCLILVGVIAVLIYFFFSVEHKGAVNKVARLGIFYMMVSFGAAFGYTVMARESLVIGRVTKLIKWASPDYYYATIILLFIIIGLVVLTELFSSRGERTE